MIRTTRPIRRKGTRGKTVSVVPVVLDPSCPAPGSTINESILSLPLGTGRVLDALLSPLEAIGQGPVLVVSEREPGLVAARGGDGRPAGPRLVNGAAFAELLATFEASDFLLLVDPRHWVPAAGHFEALARRCAQFRGALHAVAVGLPRPTARERVMLDGQGRIRRVRRLYDEMNWPELASSRILCSVVPAYALHDMDLASLGRVRSQCADRGILSQDVPIQAEAMELSDPAGILAANEWRMTAAARSAPHAGYTRRAQGVLVAAGCRIHPSARLVGPAVVQPGVHIDEETQVIGPCVLGADSRVRRRAMLAGSVLGAGADLPADASVCGGLVLRGAASAPSNGNGRAHREGNGKLHREGNGKPNGQPGGKANGQSGGKSAPPVSTAAAAAVHPATDRWDAGEPAYDAGRAFQLALKRGLDILGAGLGLILLGPLLLLVALAIKLTSRGPVFFVHRREGRGGAEFPCIKFRSMVAGAHRQQRELYRDNQVDGPQFKLLNDPRATRVGRLLRRTNFDEIPQLFNVLAGQMSLVGPRPSPFRENQVCIPWRRARLSVRPGITGLWQLCRDKRVEGDFHQWIYYDLAYVRHFSLWLDVKVLFYTVVTLGGRKRVRLSRLVPADREGEKP